MDEVPDKHPDNARQRTKPADCGPYSPARIAALYREGKEYPLGKHGAPDRHTNQFPEDQHTPGYDNDSKGWVRSQGENSTVNRPGGFDHGKFDIASKPQKATRPRNTASGQDCHRSPFSAAHKTYGED